MGVLELYRECEEAVKQIEEEEKARNARMPVMRGKHVR